MSEYFKTVQWNIGGGMIRTHDADPTKFTSYDQPGLDHIIETLRWYEPDIATIQEAHADDNSSQVQQITDALGHRYSSVSDVCSPSHITPGKMSSQGIISSHPMWSIRFACLITPALRPRGLAPK